jgi:hypothetical protein
MGSLKGKTFILDEFLSTIQEAAKEVREPLWRMVLTGFAKQGARVRIVTHAKTASANQLPPGLAETFKSEIKMLWTERRETELGYLPSGNYTVLQEVEGFYRESSESLTIPDWLLTETNPHWHDAPCPVRTLLKYFPEFAEQESESANTGLSLDLNLSLNQTYQNNPSDNLRYGAEEVELKQDLSQVFTHIKELLPNVGDKITARRLHRSAGASTVGISSENASEYMQKLAETESESFAYLEETNNVGNVSRVLTRIS